MGMNATAMVPKPDPSQDPSTIPIDIKLSRGQLWKIVGFSTGGMVAIMTFLFKFWFGAVSALPFLYTQDWHAKVDQAVAQQDGDNARLIRLEGQTENTIALVNQVATLQHGQQEELRQLHSMIQIMYATQIREGKPVPPKP